METLLSVWLANMFGIDMDLEVKDLMTLIVRFTFNAISCWVIARWLYFPNHKKRDYLFTFMLFSTIVFFLCFLLSSVKLSMGFALGLFAIFGILRYRTDTIAIKEMTYLFIIIGVSVINALASTKVTLPELLFTNLALIFSILLLEKIWGGNHEVRKTINYEKIDLVKPQNHPQLMEDLKERTGLNIHKIEIGRIDFLNDTAQIRIYFYEDENASFCYEPD